MDDLTLQALFAPEPHLDAETPITAACSGAEFGTLESAGRAPGGAT